MTLVKRLEALKPFLETHHCRTDTIDDAIAALSSTDGDDGLVERLREEASCWSDADEGSPSSVIHEAARCISSLNVRLSEMREALWLFREFTIRNATQWEVGCGHHHPIWAHIAELIGEQGGIVSGPLFEFIQPDNRDALNLSEGGV
jgi:hypothetical protein